MATNNNQLRSRYGICLNDQCTLSKEKKVQEIVGRKEFVCSECGKPLKECRPPKTWWEINGKKTIIAALVLLIAVGAGYILFISKQENSGLPKEPVEKGDSLVALDPVGPDTLVTASVSTNVTEKVEVNEERASDGFIHLDYGRYKGESKNGKPHGHGVITYTKQHKIISSKEYVANPGDRYEGEFREGKVSGGMGYWYHNGDITAIKP